ncbi:hypothetical protein SAMN05421767_12710 [Granulicatella balaenopterae]|uniref:ABC-2 family transporter protein n=1 Tax=Granulicatella balaenopterae TaxID=137733 RepID=A0A1H9MHB6_9LACT|nr:hypothetical protein [Granulicatella balaenopterae]SER23110.1 hypothetical protein SAMN05421767_12710 [Granulicatella balaenopterae]
MKKYLKLLAYELENSKKLIAILVVGVTLLQSVSFIQMIRDYKRVLQLNINQALPIDMVKCDFATIMNGWFVLSIMGSVALIGAYIFYIWFKEWYRQGKSIYRLLMLPGSRMSVYWAKFTTIIMMILILLGLEIVLLTIFINLASWIVGDQLVNTANNWYLFTQGSSIFGNPLEVLYPATWMNFLITYGVGICVVSACFQLVILAMSSRHLRKVQSIGVMVLNVLVYGIYIAGLIFLITNLMLTSSEISWVMTIVLAIFLCINTLVSRHLLNHYIAV